VFLYVGEQGTCFGNNVGVVFHERMAIIFGRAAIGVDALQTFL